MKDINMLCDVSIEYKDLDSFFELSIGLSE